MTMDIDKAVQEGFIKPARSLRIRNEQEEEFQKGLTFEAIGHKLFRLVYSN